VVDENERRRYQMTQFKYSKGLHDLGKGVYAYLQPDGSWGLSNAGLIVDGEKSLLVDTLFDLTLTQEMLNAMKEVTKAAESIDILVNTHSNGDHVFGNQLVSGAEIITSEACAQEMAATPPQMLAQLLKSAAEMGELGEYLTQIFGKYNFDDIIPTPPTRTFEKRLDIKVGDKEVNLIEVGPAHTRGDILVHVPSDRVVGMDLEAVVPGHGPITDKRGVEAVKRYLEYIYREAQTRYEAGMSVEEAAMDIGLSDFASLTDGERIGANVHALYREFSGDTSPANPGEVFGLMAKVAKGR
jgi:glyoxylase-like metal-dependent hydrolase (beta-lactamase superfamily II)